MTPARRDDDGPADGDGANAQRPSGRRSLPPLTGLRAFEVAARRLSFKAAAEELALTPTAVSHRIRTLEDWLDVRLFNRLTRALTLTREGAALAPKIAEAFALLEAAALDVRRTNDDGDLVLSAAMSFASNWLAPRLPRFSDGEDAPRLRVEGSDALTDFARSNVDLAIRYGFGGYEGLHAERLFTDFATPVCTPERAAGVRTAADLLELARIEYRWSGFHDNDPSWEKWFRAAGADGPAPAPSSIVSDEHMALSGALGGDGVALVGLVAAETYLREGRLAVPVPLAIENRAYYFVCPAPALRRPGVAAFRDWLIGEARWFEETLYRDGRLNLDQFAPPKPL